MTVGRKGAHVVADLGDQRLSDVVADAGDVFQSLDGLPKRSKRGLQVRVEFRNRGFDLFDRLQMLADQEAMMVARTPLQGGDEVLARAGELGMTERRQPPRIALARHDRLQDAPAAEAQDIRNDRGELDIGLLQRRLNPLGMTNNLARQFAPRARQIAQFLDRLGRHKAGADQAMRQEIGDPGCVVGVALAARHVANVRGVGQN